MMAEMLPEEQGDDLEELLRTVREISGVDLTQYRRTTLSRRIGGRLQKLGCRDYREYARLLAEDPEESAVLLEQVTIKVSSFFRNPQVFALLRDRVLPELLARAAPKVGIRIWSAGCGNGEEAYSLAILVEEISRQQSLQGPSDILGTDVDAGALEAARRGLYPRESLAETSADLIDAYFSAQPGRFGPVYELVPSIRRRVLFQRHDLLSGHPAPGGGHFDLILCRNVLIYFSRSAQEGVFRLLRHSLAVGGYLCLGEAEQLPSMERHHFATVGRRAGLYRKTGGESQGGRP